MNAFDRQLDRVVRDVPLSAPVPGPLARPPVGGCAQQAAPATPSPLAHDTGAAALPNNRSAPAAAGTARGQ